MADDMTASLPTMASSTPQTAYAGFAVRFRALLIDAIVVFVAVIVGILLAAAAPGSEVATRSLLLALVAVLVLYEPVMVWRFGATIGHRRSNVMVVADRTGANPGFLRALFRYLVKAVLGLPSFVAMALTERHQAVHDRLAGTTVQIRDLAKAQPGDAKWARDPQLTAGLPSGPRRTGIILAYLVLSLIVVGIVSALTMSNACLSNDSACTAGEKLWNGALSLGWLAVMACIVIWGWRGRLPGARRRVVAGGDAVTT